MSEGIGTKKVTFKVDNNDSESICVDDNVGKPNQENQDPPVWQKESPEESASLIAKLSFSWVFPFFWRAVKQGENLDFTHLDVTRNAERPEQYLKKVREMFFIDKDGKPSISLRQGLVGLIGKDIFGSMLLINVAVLFGYINPFLIEIIVQVCTPVETDSNENDYVRGVGAGVAASFGMALTGFTSVCLAQIAWHVGCRCARGAYIAVSSLLYEKPSVITNTEMSSFSEGEIVNLMAIDCQTVFQVVVLFNLFAILPSIVLGSVGLLFYALGWPVMVLFAVLLANTFFVDFLSKKVTKLQNKKNSLSDQRGIRMNESLQGIRTVKLNAWEGFVKERIMSFRRKEAVQLWYIAGLRSLQFFMSNAVPLLSMIGTFMLHRYAIEEELTVETVFFSVPLFIQLSFGLVFIPNMLNEYRRYRVSVDRLEKFLILKEEYKDRVIDSTDGSVTIEDVSLAWSRSMKESDADQENDDSVKGTTFPKSQDSHDGFVAVDVNPTEPSAVLHNLNLSIKSGELIAVVGQVASGKTTFVNGILNLVEATRGSIKVNGRTAYVAQSAFVMNATIRENICFGTEYDEFRYRQVLEACCLVSDIRTFSDGDQTEVGEKGVTISGGQKQRIALARAAYSKKDIVLFDDCLSAMDAHVGENCFENCIVRLLAGSTRILVTNQLNFAERCDRIVVLEGGTIAEIGTYDELFANTTSFFRTLVEHQVGSDTASSTEEKEGMERETSIEEILDEKFANDIQDESLDSKDQQDRSETKGAELITEEKKAKGRIGIRDFVFMARAAKTRHLLAFMALLLLIVPTLQFLVTYFIGEWAGEGAPTNLEAVTPILIVAICFSFGTALLSLTLNRFFMDSANNLHDNMLEKVFACPSSWFDTTPVGRILQRFSGDIMHIDIMLPRLSEMWYDNFGQVLVGIVPAAIILPPFLVLVVPMVWLFVKAYKYYGLIMLECQRLALISVGPILSSFSTFLQGLDTIRAFERIFYFIDKFYANNDKFCRTMYCQFNIDRLFIVYMTGFAITVFIFVLGSLIVGLRDSQFVTPEVAGLLLAYAVSLNFRVFGLFFTTAQVERLMASSQRCIEFLHLDSEKETTISAVVPTTDESAWPKNGDIVFKSVEMSYRSELPLVLKGISFSIESGEKVALVGRSGCGKSSIVLTLFRIVEIATGSICIAGYDNRSIDVHILRDRIGMIPQDSWLFAGPLRQNLDINGRYTDEDIWRALELVNLKETVESFSEKLDHQVEEKGDNLSGGTVQLLCLARVLLKQPKIIVMDEATSSVDLVTDAVVQRTIRNCFKDSTLLAIAHRLHTIIDFDKIIAIDAGKVAEIGSPHELLTQKNDGIFSSLVKATGEKSARELLSRSKRNVLSS